MQGIAIKQVISIASIIFSSTLLISFKAIFSDTVGIIASAIELFIESGNAISISILEDNIPYFSNAILSPTMSFNILTIVIESIFLDNDDIIALNIIGNEKTRAEGIEAGLQEQINALGTAAQKNIEDFATATQGATADTTAATIATYGDIVTHNASEFATSAQGTKADNAAPANTVYTKTEVDAFWAWEEL